MNGVKLPRHLVNSPPGLTLKVSVHHSATLTPLGKAMKFLGSWMLYEWKSANKADDFGLRPERARRFQASREVPSSSPAHSGSWRRQRASSGACRRSECARSLAASHEWSGGSRGRMWHRQSAAPEFREREDGSFIDRCRAENSPPVFSGHRNRHVSLNHLNPPILQTCPISV